MAASLLALRVRRMLFADSLETTVTLKDAAQQIHAAAVAGDEFPKGGSTRHLGDLAVGLRPSLRITA